jgi:hypothetical protein
MQQHVMKTHLEDEVWLHVFFNSLKVVSWWSKSLYKVLRSEKQWLVSWAPKAVCTKDKLLAPAKTERRLLGLTVWILVTVLTKV